MRRTLLLLLPAPLMVVGLLALAQAPAIDTAINARIRTEGTDHSQILKTLHYLTDVYGPRLTGSPNHERAARWAVQQMETWGLTNGHLEPWDFGRDGWLNQEASGHIVSPVTDNLVFEVLAWTPSTNGTVTGPAVQLIAPLGPPAGTAGRGGVAPRLGPTAEELHAYLASIAPKIKGAVVLVGAGISVPFQETSPAKRRDDEATRRQFTPTPNPPAPGRGGAGRQGGRGAAPVAAPQEPVRLSAQQLAARLNEFLVAEGAAVRVMDAGLPHGQIRAFNYSGYDVTKTVPTAVVRNEDYGRITRLLADGADVRLKFTIVNRSYPEGRTSYNAIAEIPGTDKAAEVVMLGGHLDSWHAATGATDNAVGCAVMMEAVRILQAIGVRPRRTIRVALWSGEEQGLLGSRAYVAEHFGTLEKPKPEFASFNGYFNLDSGTGRVRGASVFGPPEAAATIAHYLRQFDDLGVYGATGTTNRGGGGTDHAAFNAAGLPGINLAQDPIEYESHTWHSNLDTLERIVERDVKSSAIAIASAVYHVAMSEDRLPRIK